MEIRREYPCNVRNYQGRRAQPVSFLVLHYVGATGGAEANVRYYHGTPGIGASAHYFVDHAPAAGVWASVPEDCVASHCGRSDGKYWHPRCRNANSIGIEMCCHRREDGAWYIDAETVDAAVALSRDIMARYGIPVENVLRHYDVTGKRCPMPWVDDPGQWEAFKRRLEESDMTKDKVQAIVEMALAERDEAVARSIQTVSTWAYPQWEKAVKAGVFDGTRPGGYLTREQAAVILDRLGLIKEDT